MTKLTNTHRAAIADKALDAGRLTREAALTRQEHSLTLRATKFRFGDDVFERCRALPEGWLGVHKMIQFNYNTVCNLLPCRQVVHPRTPSRRWSWEQRVPANYKLDLSDVAVLPNAFAEPWQPSYFSGTLWDEVQEHFAGHIALFDEMELLRAQVKSTLLSFTTVERLAEDWPEGYAFLPPELVVPTTANLPAVLKLDDLNRRLAAFQQEAA